MLSFLLISKHAPGNERVLQEPSLPSLPFEGQSHYAQTFVRHRAPSPEPPPGAGPSVVAPRASGGAVFACTRAHARAFLQTRHPFESDEADLKQARDKRPVQAFHGASSAHVHYPAPPPEAYQQLVHQVQAANQVACLRLAPLARASLSPPANAYLRVPGRKQQARRCPACPSRGVPPIRLLVLRPCVFLAEPQG